MISQLSSCLVLISIAGLGFVQAKYGGYEEHGHGHHHHGHNPGYDNVGYAIAKVPARISKVVDYYAHPKYSFAYGVNDHYTGDMKRAHEVRDGDVVKGSYSFVQPDGILRTVNYVADPIHGFQAQVINSAPEVKKAILPAVVPVAVGHSHYGHHHPTSGVAKPVAVSHPHHHTGYYDGHLYNRYNRGHSGHGYGDNFFHGGYQKGHGHFGHY